MCLLLSSPVASWLHPQEALKLSSQADDASAHHKRMAAAWGERMQSGTGDPQGQLKETAGATESRDSQVWLCVSTASGAC